jgi:PAS domain S-box-containing protein
VTRDDLLLRFLRSAADAIVVSDPAGIITYWNDAAATMFGWPAAEAVGHSLDLIIPERFRDRHWRGWHAAIERRSTSYADRLLQVPALRRDGAKISIASTMTFVYDASGVVEAVAAVIRDETEARAQRLELEAKVRATEAST